MKKMLLSVICLGLSALFLLCACDDTAQGLPSLSDRHSSAESAPPTPEPTPTPSQSPDLSSPSPAELPHLFERAQFKADFCGYSRDKRYFVANFNLEGLGTSRSKGSFLFVLDEQLSADLQPTLSERPFLPGTSKNSYKKESQLEGDGQSGCIVYTEYALYFLEDYPLADVVAIEHFDIDENSTISVYRYVKEPLKDLPLIAPIVVIDPGPLDKFDPYWLEWLIDDYGDTYPMVWEGGLYNGIKYAEDMDPSAFEIRPYTDKIPNEFSHFHLCMYMSQDEFDGYTGLGKEGYPYTWKVFYRPDGSDEDYESVEMVPWSAITFGDNYFYRLNLHDYGAKLSLKEDGSTQTYHFIFIILDQEGEIVIWRDELVDWTDSSQAYYEDALRLGIIKEYS